MCIRDRVEAECTECGEGFNPKRKDLGYHTCLSCGDLEATKQTMHKKKCLAPAYNKGAYMYVSSSSMAKELGR